MMTLRQHVDQLVDDVEEKMRTLDIELRRCAAEENPELQKVCMVALPSIRAKQKRLKKQRTRGAPVVEVIATLIALDRDVTSILLVLQGKIRVAFQGEEPN